MRYEGKVWKDGEHWLIEVSALEVMTQGYSFEEAGLMIKDAIESLINQEGLELFVEFDLCNTDPEEMAEASFRLTSNDPQALEALARKRKGRSR